MAARKVSASIAGAACAAAVPSEVNDPAIWKEGDGWASVTAEYFWKEADGWSTATAGRRDLGDRQVGALHSSLLQFAIQILS
jgi:hypothetical protein